MERYNPLKAHGIKVTLERCRQCKNRIVVDKCYADVDGSMVHEFYWYCIYDQAHNEICTYFMLKDN
jgi:hypothetical protein